MASFGSLGIGLGIGTVGEASKRILGLSDGEINCLFICLRYRVRQEFFLPVLTSISFVSLISYSSIALDRVVALSYPVHFYLTSFSLWN